jgi:hypothetical protein
MSCGVKNCKCSCHYSSEPDIKQLLLSQFKTDQSDEIDNVEQQEIYKQQSMLLFGDNDEENEKASTSLLGDSDELWERRRRLHSGQEKPLSYDDYHHQFLKLEQLKKIQPINEEEQDEIYAIQNARRALLNQTQEFATLKPEPTKEVKKPEPTKEVKKPEPTKEVKKSEPTKEVKKPEPTKEVKKSEPTKEVKKPEPTKEVKKPGEDYIGPKPVPLNPLHKLKVEERDVIIRRIYGRAVSNVRSRLKTFDAKSAEYKQMVSAEADTLLDEWMQANK